MAKVKEFPGLEAVTLLKGSHATRDEGCCALEAVAWMANREHGDHPECVCPVLSDFVRKWNDRLDDDVRQQLKPFLPKLMGTAEDGKQRTRIWLIVDWSIREVFPMWLDLLGELPECPEVLKWGQPMRALPPITDKASLEAARPVLALARTAADASRLAISTIFALDLALDLARELTLALDRALALARARDLALDRALARDRALFRALALDLARALALARALTLARTLTLALDRDLRNKLNQSVFGVLTRMTA